MIKELQSLSLLDILPANLLEDKKVAAAAQALDAELQAVTKATVETMHLPRLDVLPEAVVDLLAWQWHVDFYEPLGMDIETKRKLVKESIAWHRIKGTPAAVEAVVSAAFDSSKVKEWYEYGGKPFYFKVITEDVTTDKVTLDNMRRAIDSVKNARSWLEKIEFLLHLKDIEELNENALFNAETDKIEFYPWLGRYFDGSWNFTAPSELNGERVFDGKWLFDAVADGEEDLPRKPHLFAGETQHDGSWLFGVSIDSRKIFFNSFEVDPLSMLEPEIVLPENYNVTLDFAGAGRLLDGSWKFGLNDLDDSNVDLIETLSVSDTEKLKESDSLMATEKVFENYPTIQMRFFDGTWMFRQPTTFNGDGWFGGELHFDGIPHNADPKSQSALMNGAWGFSGSMTFSMPSPVVLFNADEDAGDRLTTAFGFSPVIETQHLADCEMEVVSLMPSDRMLRNVFNGENKFNGWVYSGGYVEKEGEQINVGISDRIQHADNFDGSYKLDGSEKCGSNEGPAENLHTTVIEGRWFNGACNFDGGNTVYFDGLHDFDGAIFYCLLRDTAIHYDGEKVFNGYFRYKRPAETFNQYSYIA